MRNYLFRMGVFLLGICFSSWLFAAGSLACIQLKPLPASWSSGFVVSNLCGKPVDFQSGLIEFQSNQSLKGNYWGNFSPLAYPENPTVSSQSMQSGYLVRLALTFPKGDQWWRPVTTLPAGSSITIKFSTTPQTSMSSLAFYPMTQPVVSQGQLTLQFPVAPDASITAPSTVTVSNGTDYTQNVSGQWSQAKTLSAVPFGAYQISVKTINSNGQTWLGAAAPATININSVSTNKVSISYTKGIQYGSITVYLNQVMPESNLATPVLQIKDLDANLSLPSKTLAWSGQTSISQLTLNHRYQFFIDNIYGTDNFYVASFNPSATISVTSATTVPVSVQFQSMPIPTVAVPYTVSGLPDSQTTQLTAVDNHGRTYQKTIQNSAQTMTWDLPTNQQYQLSSAGLTLNNTLYQAAINPSQLLLETTAPTSPIVIAYTGKVIATEVSPYVDMGLSDVTVWDNATNSMQPKGLISIVNNSGVKSLHLAFVTASSGCQGTWAGYPVSADPNGFGIAVFKQLKQQGVKLTVSFGGAAGTYLEQSCGTTQELVKVYQTIVQAYNPDVLDFDIENAMQTNNAQLDRMMQALVQIKQQYPNVKLSFTLPVMPEGLVPGVGLNVLQRAKLAGLSDYLVNVMAMDYGSSFTAKSMGQYAIDAANSTFNQLKVLYPTQSDAVLWQRIGLTPMIGLNDTIPLNYSLSDVTETVRFAAQKQLGLLAFWSINRDHRCVANYLSNTCSSSNPTTGAANQSSDYQYSRAFMGN